MEDVTPPVLAVELDRLADFDVPPVPCTENVLRGGRWPVAGSMTAAALAQGLVWRFMTVHDSAAARLCAEPDQQLDHRDRADLGSAAILVAGQGARVGLPLGGSRSPDGGSPFWAACRCVEQSCPIVAVVCAHAEPHAAWRQGGCRPVDVADSKKEIVQMTAWARS